MTLVEEIKCKENTYNKATQLILYGLTLLNINFMATFPFWSQTGRRRDSFPFWKSTTVGSCFVHDDVLM